VHPDKGGSTEQFLLVTERFERIAELRLALEQSYAENLKRDGRQFLEGPRKFLESRKCLEGSRKFFSALLKLGRSRTGIPPAIEL